MQGSAPLVVHQKVKFIIYLTTSSPLPPAGERKASLTAARALHIASQRRLMARCNFLSLPIDHAAGCDSHELCALSPLTSGKHNK